LGVSGWEFLGRSAASWSAGVVDFSPRRAAAKDNAGVVKFDENTLAAAFGVALNFLTSSISFA
jgi:hypothetical protein